MEDKKRRGVPIFALVLLLAAGAAGTTAALVTANSNTVKNLFLLAEHETGIEETVDGASLTKEVAVTNTGKSPAFIRIRLITSPQRDEIGIVQPEGWNSEGKWIDGKDGFYYYMTAVGKNESTDLFMTGVQLAEGFEDDFEVTVYEESCVATVEAGAVSDLSEIKAAFEKATQAVGGTQLADRADTRQLADSTPG